MHDSMAAIAIELIWARMNDFETTLPLDVEKIIARKQSTLNRRLARSARRSGTGWRVRASRSATGAETLQ
jgi:hypothetical protein